jgi:SET domain-containing protein
MLTRLSKKIQMAINNLIEPPTIQSSDTLTISPGDDNISEHHRERREPHIIKFAPQGENKIKEYEIPEFELESDIQYISTVEFQDEKTSQRIKEQCLHASNNGYIDSKRKWLGALYANQIKSHYVADVSIHWIDETLEYGLFAEQDIGAWDYIGEYAGVIRRHSLILSKISDYAFLYPTSRYFYGKHLLDAELKGNEIRYANHSDDPNCEMTGVFSDGLFHMILRAIKNIPAHSQITYDYGPRYFKFRPHVSNSGDR